MEKVINVIKVQKRRVHTWNIRRGFLSIGSEEKARKCLFFHVKNGFLKCVTCSKPASSLHQRLIAKDCIFSISYSNLSITLHIRTKH
jgi:hypothetical protein